MVWWKEDRLQNLFSFFYTVRETGTVVRRK
jgi:hypothetical protein